MAPRWPKTAPRAAQDRPKTAPRASKSAPRRPQEDTANALKQEEEMKKSEEPQQCILPNGSWVQSRVKSQVPMQASAEKPSSIVRAHARYHTNSTACTRLGDAISASG